MARIDYCDTTKSNERTKEILGKNRNANIFRMMAHSPSYFEQYCRLGGAIRHKGELDPVVRELAITRTGILCEAPYEIVAHKRIGKNVGVTDEQNEALENWQAATCFNDVQRAALAFTDEIVRMHKPTDATFKAIAAKLTPAALVELQLSVGFYVMTSKFLETFGIDMQPVEQVVSYTLPPFKHRDGSRQQIHPGIGDDQAVGQQLCEVSHDPFAGPRMLFPEAFEIPQADFVGGGRHVGLNVGGAVGFQQRHFAERHARGERRQPDAVGQRDVHGAAAQKEQRRRGFA